MPGSARGEVELLAAIVEASQDAIWSLDVDGRISSWNRAAEELFGWAASEVLGQPFTVLAQPDRQEEQNDGLTRVVEGEDLRAFETVRIHRDGTPIPVSLSLTALRDDRGSPTGAAAVVRDLRPDRAAAAQASLLAAIVRSAEGAVVSIDLDGKVTAWNPAAEHLFGFPVEEVLGRPTEEFFVAPDTGPDLARMRRRLAGGDPFGPVTVHRHHRDGSVLEVSVRAFPVLMEGTIVGMSGVYTDVSAQQRDVERRALLAAVVDSSPDAILTVRDGSITSWNRGAEALFGYAASEAIGQPADFNTPEDRIGEIDLGALAGGEPVGPLETERLRRDGSCVPVSITISPLEHGSTAGVWEVFSIVARDITQQQEWQAQLLQQAFHDPLTGALNRSVLTDHLELAIRRAHRHDEPLLVAFVDLDRFKEINDAFGHATGDRLLTMVARRLEESVRAEDTVARFGGDEFVVVCETVSEEDILVIPPRIQARLKEPFSVDGQDHQLTASIGVTLGRGDSTPERLLQEADRAMYKAKRGGRAGVALHDEATAAAAGSRAEMSSGLRRALDEDQFVLHYQPIVSLTDHRVIGVEALLRWAHPTRGLLTAAEVIPAAEELGIIGPLGLWVLDTAVAQARRWQQARPDLRMAVNVSSEQLASAEFLDAVTDAAGDLSAPQRLVLELTESVALERSRRVRSALEVLHDTGVGLAVDDFGTGYSSLAYLKDLPLGTVKIDQAFVRDLPDDRDRAIVEAVMAVADRFGMDVIAEGVETSKQADVLIDLGCESAQGYLFSKPLPPDELDLEWA